MEKYRLYSVGHSNQSQEEFLQLLLAHDVNCSYTTARTTMQFDSKAFREEQSELYNSYCRPKTREATITIKRNNVED